MAITINWKTQVIFVPRVDMTLIQSNPIEIRELNLNDFRLTLKSLEDDEDGISYIQTHIHNTEVLLGGIVYARVIEIINGYTVTFEDGAYAVNLVGANSNVGDVINLNQVSVRSSNAAGLISNQAIEFSSFNGGVTVDKTNGSLGTVFPRGTPQQPVNNIPDAIIIADFRGFNTLYIKGNFVFDVGDIIDGFTIIGESPERTLLTFNNAASTSDINVSNSTITGIFDNGANFSDSFIINTQFVQGTINNCVLEGEITLAGSSLTTLVDCKDGLVFDGNQPSINFNGSGNSLAIRNYAGDISLTNKSGPENVEINIATGGHITLENTITGGNIRITGIAEITDNSNGTAVVDISHIIFPDQMQLAAFSNQVYINPDKGVAGTKFPIGTLQTPSNNIVDTLAIATFRGIGTILVDGTLVITDTNMDGKVFIGENNLDSVIVLSGTGNSTVKTTFKNMIIAGRLNGYVFIEASALQGISNIGSVDFPTIFRDCIIRSNVGVTPTLQLSNVVNGQNIHLIDCVSGVVGEGTPTLDFNNSSSPLAFRRYGGGITVKNITANQDITFEFNQGQIVLDSSCTSGKVRLGGIYKLTNNGTLTIEERNGSVSSGTFTGDTQAIAAAVWDKLTADHETANSFGEMINDILVATGQAQHTLNLNTDLLNNKPNNP
jgi:hypothetical protein